MVTPDAELMNDLTKTQFVNPALLQTDFIKLQYTSGKGMAQENEREGVGEERPSE